MAGFIVLQASYALPMRRASPQSWLQRITVNVGLADSPDAPAAKETVGLITCERFLGFAAATAKDDVVQAFCRCWPDLADFTKHDGLPDTGPQLTASADMLDVLRIREVVLITQVQSRAVAILDAVCVGLCLGYVIWHKDDAAHAGEWLRDIFQDTRILWPPDELAKAAAAVPPLPLPQVIRGVPPVCDFPWLALRAMHESTEYDLRFPHGQDVEIY